MTEPGAGLYIHVPFCRRVCPYCDFAVRLGGAPAIARYTEHLAVEIDLHAEQGWPAFDTVYFGGGTPSRLALEDLARILDVLRTRFPSIADARVFLEANPEDVTPEMLAGWRALGVATLSLGVQSLDDERLRFLGRAHDAELARRTVGEALDAGFATVSIDLIYGLPGQSAAEWQEELERAVALGVPHVSCYQLTIHARTRFGVLEARGRLAQLSVEGQAELFRLTHRRLGELGLAGYEVSSFAKAPEHRSRHNMKYWNHVPYLGIGPSAHSFREGTRWWNLRATGPWERRLAARDLPIEQREQLDPRALALEALMVGLRTYDGVDLARMRTSFGIDLRARNARWIEKLERDALLTVRGERLVPTLEGLAVADGLAGSFEL